MMTKRAVGFGVLAFLAFGCGDDNSSPHGPTATGGTGASATGGVGNAPSGGSGATPGIGGAPTGVIRGAISLNIVGTNCSLDDQFFDFPAVAGGHPVDGAAVGELLEDGGTTADGEPVRLSCTWRGLSVSMAVEIGPSGSEFLVALGSGTTVGETRVGGLSLSSDTLPDQYVSSADGPCEYVPIEVDAEARSIWGMLSCPVIEDGAGTEQCELGPSYFYFENCREP